MLYKGDVFSVQVMDTSHGASSPVLQSREKGDPITALPKQANTALLQVNPTEIY
ncbi:hypothetical protein ACHOLT_17585 [Desulfitobacterium sp. Sab5]|uniref:hypothetical protein n=1 Tax=Desulfitobacterium nosdiversum TaxID=3375356 RepID=UPI003CF73041